MRRQLVLMVAGIVLLTGILAGCGGVSDLREEAVRPATALSGCIVFQSKRTGNWDIFRVNADGTGLKSLTKAYPGIDQNPCLSRDGKQIAWARLLPSGQCIFTMNADGSNKRQVTKGVGGWDDSPSWSPDGSQIVFESPRSGRTELYRINADGTSPLRLTFSGGGDAGVPDWSPIGRMVAYGRAEYGWSQLFMLPATGGTPVPVSEAGKQALHPAWSPDAKRLAYETHMQVSPGVYKFKVFTMRVDGTKDTQVTFSKASERWPAWSPDGAYLAFSSDRAGQEDIYIKSLVGSTLIRLTTAGGSHPSWGPAA
jgi:TolB protein